MEMVGILRAWKENGEPGLTMVVREAEVREFHGPARLEGDEKELVDETIGEEGGEGTEVLRASLADAICCKREAKSLSRSAVG